MTLADEYWLHNPEQMARRLDALAAGGVARTLRYGTSFRGRDLVAFQIGSGPLQAVVVSGLHAAEMVGGFGMLAFAHSLATGRGLDGEDLASWAAETCTRQTITLVPMPNI